LIVESRQAVPATELSGDADDDETKA
jgi:hypothetical protein